VNKIQVEVVKYKNHVAKPYNSGGFLLGGDSDTVASITGAFYGKLPKDISETAMNALDDINSI